jgi:hypothetical protein
VGDADVFTNIATAFAVPSHLLHVIGGFIPEIEWPTPYGVVIVINVVIVVGCKIGSHVSFVAVALPDAISDAVVSITIVTTAFISSTIAPASSLPLMFSSVVVYSILAIFKAAYSGVLGIIVSSIRCSIVAGCLGLGASGRGSGIGDRKRLWR